MAADKIINSTVLQYFKNKLVALIPTKTSDITNDSGFITASDVPDDFLIVNITATTSGNTTTYSADKTFTEVYNHLDNGGIAIALAEVPFVARAGDSTYGIDFVEFTGYQPNAYSFGVSRMGFHMGIDSSITLIENISPPAPALSGTPTNGQFLVYSSSASAFVPTTLNVSRAVTLTAAGWSSNTQTVTVSGVLADETAQLITVTPAAASLSAYKTAEVMATSQAANSITFSCTETPSTALTVYVTIQEVAYAT